MKKLTEFEKMGLDAVILRGINDAGYEHPFPIQEKTIPSMLEGKEVIGQAKTGSGKTAAFVLPILHMIETREREVQALILAPTRELALQITDEAAKLGRYKNVKVLTIYGGQAINMQVDSLKRGIQIVVGTPGRIIDLLERGWLNLSRVKYTILDEADRMLDMGFIDDVEYILESLPKNRQLCLFSATMPEQIIALSRRYMREPVKILIDKDEPAVGELEQFYTFAERREKLQRLVDVLKAENPYSSIVFCRTKAGARRIAWELEKRYFRVLPLHGDLTQKQRESSMNAFRKGKVEILVATDVASRGIDVRGVQLVVNYDFPDEPLSYFHRVGRTARAGERGRSISILTDENLSDFHRVLKMTKSRIDPLRKEDALRLNGTSRNSYPYGMTLANTHRFMRNR